MSYGLPIVRSKSFPLLAFMALLSGGIAIGFAGIFMRLSDVNPLASAFWRMTLAAPLLWGWAWSQRNEDTARGKSIKFSAALAWAGIFFAGDMAIWHWSLHFTTVSNATLLSNFAPIFITLWFWLAYRVRFQRLFLVGMVAALVGAILLVGAGGSSGHATATASADRQQWGDGLGLFSAVFYAAYQLSIKDARNRYSTARLMAWSTTITGLCLLPFALMTAGPFFPISLAGWWPLIALALIAQLGGQTVIAYASAHLSASLSSLSLLIQPLTAAIAAWILFNETMVPLQIAGGAMLLFGIYLAKRAN